MARLSNANAVQAIRDREVFSNNSDTMTGRKRFAGWGDLPEEHRIPDPEEAAIVFWVYSYGTPIAWIDANETAHMPAVRYTRTTDRQQKIVAEALHIPFRAETTVTPAEEL